MNPAGSVDEHRCIRRRIPSHSGVFSIGSMHEPTRVRAQARPRSGTTTIESACETTWIGTRDRPPSGAFAAGASPNPGEFGDPTTRLRARMSWGGCPHPRDVGRELGRHSRRRWSRAPSNADDDASESWIEGAPAWSHGRSSPGAFGLECHERRGAGRRSTSRTRRPSRSGGERSRRTRSRASCKLSSICAPAWTPPKPRPRRNSPSNPPKRPPCAPSPGSSGRS